jgi:hypothetical protein
VATCVSNPGEYKTVDAERRDHGCKQRELATSYIQTYISMMSSTILYHAPMDQRKPAPTQHRVLCCCHAGTSRSGVLFEEVNEVWEGSRASPLATMRHISLAVLFCIGLRARQAGWPLKKEVHSVGEGTTWWTSTRPSEVGTAPDRTSLRSDLSGGPSKSG